ncbi:MAG TPA: cardiolipin synthase [Thermoanaerobaculia bacterium]
MIKHRDKPDRFRIWQEGSTTFVKLPLVLFIGGILLLIVLTVLVWSIKRESDVVLRSTDPGNLDKLIPSIVGLTQGSLDAGNQIEITQNGDGFWPRLFADIGAARHSVHVESFIWYESPIATQLATLLARKAKEGVHVRVLVDGSGGRKLRGEVREMLDRSGAEVAHFHPIRISNLGRINNRDHRKLWIIDGRIAYIGGYGIAQEWTGNAQSKKHYRDTGLRITGPTVNRLQGAFCENWIEETGEIPSGEEYFPPLPPTGPTAAHVAYTSPSYSASSVQVLYYMAIKAARREILIQNPYMLPDEEAIEALIEAAKRGVDVRIMVPSDETNDSAIVQHASHHHFGTLLQHGIKIWEYDKTLLHQKVIVVDGVWSCVGSTNFDDRSFQLNDEITVGIIDPGIAAQLRSAFADDMRHAKQRQIGEWKDRGLWHKTVDGLAYLARAQL